MDAELKEILVSMQKDLKQLQADVAGLKEQSRQMQADISGLKGAVIQLQKQDQRNFQILETDLGAAIDGMQILREQKVDKKALKNAVMRI
ncbi:hypothetical protein NE619_06430 [Anaerovorax odorimutans]|uniref:Uncharacterized protein n=1 Tax=Anaerovorax odorimutans TaxID=109327 RepID=A0ABT1RMF7_9FIRM|nr:hypothetical protein [Anaerovorax odorimutans]MCQ4636359.1 hypothetical protein [Anaerovorax odorimutans]